MRTLEKRMQNELLLRANNGVLGDGKSVWARFKTMANQATTGASLLAKITLVIATVGICFQVAYIFIPYFSNQDKRLSIMEQQREADHKLVIDAVQNINKFLTNSIEVRKEEIDAQKLPKVKKDALKAKLIEGVKITGANSQPAATGTLPAYTTDSTPFLTNPDRRN